MDGRTSVALACAIVGAVWVTVGGAILIARLLRAHRVRASARPELAAAQRDGWEDWALDTVRVETHLRTLHDAERDASDRAALEHLRQGLWSREPEVRRAAVTALGKLAARSDLAVDGLIEALAERRDAPARVAMQLDRVAPRADARLVPLLGHPESLVRCYAARLLSRSGSAELSHVLELRNDPAPRVRVAALQALESTSTVLALRMALRLLDDAHPRVRAQACRTASAISPVAAADLVAGALRDESWEVREAAHESLVRYGGPSVVGAILPLLDEHENPAVRSLAAMILLEIGFVDELVEHGSDGSLLERIRSAGGRRLRARTDGSVVPAERSTAFEAGL